jgi:hypothetical protein
MAAKTKPPTHTVETLDTAAPNGEEAVKVTCHCAVCAGRGAATIVGRVYAEEYNLSAQTMDAYTHVHNLVLMANGPLAHAPQVKANGPWKA